jgi:hypothetical protein
MTRQAQKFHDDLVALTAVTTMGAAGLNNREDVLVEIVTAMADVLGKTIPLISNGDLDKLGHIINVAQKQVASTAVAACIDLVKMKGSVQ